MLYSKPASSVINIGWKAWDFVKPGLIIINSNNSIIIIIVIINI